MNHTYRLKRCGPNQQLQAVPETARSAGKGSRTGKALAQAVTAMLASVALGGITTLTHSQQAPPAPNQLPQGGVVTRGSASIDVNAANARMTVNQTSPRAVIDWASFNVGSQAQVQFNQPGRDAVVLNHILGNNASQIYGQITANGQVFLSNPNGVYFSPTAQVHVGGLVATTGRAHPDAFMAGSAVFHRDGSTGSVVNEGQLKSALGGYIALLAPEVRNQGLIVAQAGTVAMASGETVALNFHSSGTGLAGITTTPQAIAAVVENRSAVLAEGGQIILSAHALATLQGSVVKNSGHLNATSLVERGGKIVLMADRIELTGTSQIEANGPQGGGTVLVGGDWQGSGDMRQATQVTMEAGARIDASATDQGDGGKVVLWSDIHHPASVTRVEGSIRAEAGPHGGDGGTVETSGRQLLVGDLKVSTRAPQGTWGEWLLDPYDLTISADSTSGVAITYTSVFPSGYSANANDSVVNVSALQSALGSTSVTIDTGSSGSQTGNITLASNLSWSSAAGLTLRAAGGFTGSGNIAMTGGGSLNIQQMGNSTYAGAISGATGKLALGGVGYAGTLSLTGNNSYGGLTTLTNGTLNLGSAAAISSGTGKLLFNGGTLQYSSSNTTDYSGRFDATTSNQKFNIDTNGQDVTLSTALNSAGGTLTKSGTGVLTLTAASTYTGLTTISAGTLALSGAGGMSSSFGVTNAGLLDISNTTSGASIKNLTGSGNVTLGAKLLLITSTVSGNTYSGVISGTGNVSLTNSASATTFFSSDQTYTGTTTVSSGTLVLGDTGGTALAGSLAGPINLSGGTLRFNRANAYSFANDVSGTGGLKFSGAGVVTLSGNLTYTAQTAIDAGATAALSGSASLGTSSVVSNGGTLDISGTTTGASLKYMTGSGATVLGSKTLTFTALISGQSYAGVISGTGGFVLPASGSFSLTGNSTYTGGTTIPVGGALVLGAAGATGSIVGPISLGGALTVNRTGSVTLDGAISGAGTLNFSGSGNLTLGGTNTATGTLNWNSSGSLTLSDANAWGALSVPSNRTLYVSGQGNLPSTVVTLAASNSTLDISGATSGVTLKGLTANSYPAGIVLLGSNTLTLAMPSGAASTLGLGGAIRGTGGISVVNTSGAGTATFNLQASNAYTGPTTVDTFSTLALGTTGSIATSSGLNLAGTLSSSVSAGATLKTLSGTGTVSISTGSLSINNASGEFAGQLALSVPLFLSSGRLLLSGNNTQFTGAINLDAATLELGHAGALGPASAVNSLTISSGGTLDLRGWTPLASRAMTISFGGGTITNSVSGSATLNSSITHNTLNAVLTVDAASNGSLNLTGTLSGGGALIKGMGLGTVVMSGYSPSRTGTTTINGGTLQVGTLDSTNGTVGNGSVTNNANLLVYRSGALTLSSPIGDISGTGNVTVQATGTLNIDRNITLTGANSTIRLIAGASSAANTALTSDLTLARTVTTSSTGTLVLFAGSPTATVANGSTSNLGLKLSGATGSLQYKTYNADLTSLSSVVAGTRNFYYRLQPTLSVTGATVTATKVYDGTLLAANAVVTGGSVSGAIDGDSMGFSADSATYTTANAGTNKSMALSLRARSNSASWSVTGYATSATGTTSSGTITPAPLVVQANDDARFVTLSDAVGYAGASYSGLVNQETSAVLGGTLAITRSTPAANAAGQYTLTPSGLTATNYNITYRTGTYTIVPANQLLIRVADASTVYGTTPSYSISSARYLMPDGSVVDLTSQLNSSGGIYTLNDGASGTAQFSLALSNPTTSTSNNPVVGVWNVAAAGAVTTSANFSNSLSVVGTQTITPRPLAVTATAAGKVYDGTTTASGVSLSNNRISGDLLTTNYTGATFASKDAAAGVTVTVSGITASGADISNYQTPNTNATTTATITPKPLNLSGLSASAKTYDGSTSATVSSYGTLTGVLGVDDVQIDSSQAVATFATRNVGVGKTVNVSGLVLGGASVGNYSLANPFTTTANITAKALTVSGTSVAHKVYDGTTLATLSGGTLVGVVSSDTDNVLLTQAGSFSNKNVGTGKAVTASNTLSGSEASNYTLTQPTGLTANITPKTLTVKANNDANFFALADSTTTFNGVAYSGFVTGESSADLTFANGVGPTVTSSLTAGQRSTAGTYVGVLTPSGINAGNYTPVYQTGDFTVVPADKLLIRVPNSSATYGTATTVATPTASYYSSTYGTVVGNVTATPNAGAFDFVDSTYGGSVTVQLAPDALASQRSASGNANVGTYNLAATSVTNLVGGNFSNAVQVLGVQTITPKALTVTATASTKTYDGAYTAAVSLGSADAVTGDALQYSSTSAVFANKNVRTGETVTVQGLSLSGADAGNYLLQNTTASSTANINPKSLTVTGTTVANKVYDGSTTATLMNGSLVGVVAADTSNVALTQAGIFSDKNIGTGKVVTAANTISGSQASNYTLTQPTGLIANITPRALTISGITAVDKVYDGSATATVSTAGVTGSVLQSGGMVAGDSVIVSATGSFRNAGNTANDKNVGTGKTVALSSTYGGTDATNYTITDQATTTASITPKPLTISGITAADKVYDGSATATVSTAGVTNSVLQTGGMVAGDSVTVSATGSFRNAGNTANDKGAGTGKIVALSSTYGGSDATNYTITDQATTTASITPKPLTISGITAADKVYDGSATATVSTAGVTGSVLQSGGMVAGDSVIVSATGSFRNAGNTANDKNVGTGKTVALSSTYSGSDATNYTITDQTTTTASITPKPLTISGITAAAKVYDGSATATVSTAGVTNSVLQTGGMVAGDSVTVSATGSFRNAGNTANDKGAGTGKTVALTSSYGGTDATNYTITDQATTTASITPKPLTISGIAATDKVYDGNATATVSTAGVTNSVLQTGGLVAGDSVTVSATGTFRNAGNTANDKNVGTGKTVALSSTYGGSDATNYTITDQTTTTASITAKPLTISGITAADKVYDGNATAIVSTAGVTSSVLQAGGLVAGDSVTVSATGTFRNAGNTANDKNAGTGKTVALTSTYGGTDATNYTITDQATTTASITPKALTVSADSARKTQDGQAYTGGNGVSYSGFASNETASVLGGSLSFGGSSQGAVTAGSYVITTSGLSSGNYAITFQDGTLTVDPAPTPASASSGSGDAGALQLAIVKGTAGRGAGVDNVTAISSRSGQPISVVSQDSTVPASTSGSYAWPALQAVKAPDKSDTGLLGVTILGTGGSAAGPAAVAFEQDGVTISLRTASPPLVRPANDRVVFSSRMTEFMVQGPQGELVAFSGGLVNRRLVVVATTAESKQLAQASMNLVLAGAIMALGKDKPIVLASLDGVVLDLR